MENLGLFTLFVVLNLANVVLQTWKGIVTIKGGKFQAAAANSVAFGFYTIVLVYVNCELSLLAKVLVVGGVNFIGVWFVKTMELRSKKDKLWKVEATILHSNMQNVEKELTVFNIPYSVIEIVNSKNYIVNIYCNTQKESSLVKMLLNRNNAKYFVAESKTL